jgi:hypothetical protein
VAALSSKHAAAVTGDRRLVAETIGRVALLASPLQRRAAEVALRVTGPRYQRISIAWAGPVPRRVAALLAAPPRTRAVLLAVCAALVLLAGVSALEAARDLHALLELAQAAR